MNTVDPDLPEEDTRVERVEPLALLEEMAARDDPSLRGRALGFLVASDASTWAERALHDPDGWVQLQAARALGDREKDLLAPLVSRAGADPYTRALVALESGVPVVDAWRAETDPWRALPLAYAALVQGETAASEGLVRGIARGEIALEEDFVRALGRCRELEPPAGSCEPILKALQDGESWVEEELHLSYGVARLLLGDGSGEQLLRKSLGGDVRMQVATLDQLATLESPEATALLRKASGSSDSLPRTYAHLILASRAHASTDLFREAALSSNDEVRALAARFAGVRLARGEKKGARQLEQLIATASEDSASNVRQAAIEAARVAKLEAEVFERALTDASSRVRLIAAGALLSK